MMYVHMSQTTSIPFLSEIYSLQHRSHIIVEQLLRTHDSDGRWIDSKALLQEVEAILSFVLESDVSQPLPTENCMTNIEVFDSKETLPYAISRISVQVTDHLFLLKYILLIKMPGSRDLETLEVADALSMHGRK
ncbi:hypothetical protein YC2023_079644 [Brassica napus]